MRVRFLFVMVFSAFLSLAIASSRAYAAVTETENGVVIKQLLDLSTKADAFVRDEGIVEYLNGDGRVSVTNSVSAAASRGGNIQTSESSGEDEDIAQENTITTDHVSVQTQSVVVGNGDQNEGKSADTEEIAVVTSSGQSSAIRLPRAVVNDLIALGLLDADTKTIHGAVAERSNINDHVAYQLAVHKTVRFLGIVPVRVVSEFDLVPETGEITERASFFQHLLDEFSF